MKISVYKLLIIILAFMPVVVSAQSAKTITPSTTQTTPKKKKVSKKKGPKKAKTSTAVATPVKEVAPKALDMPIMTFNTKIKEFGSIKTGDKPEFTYEFTNTGTKPLDIDIVSGCDCTELDWTRKTVNPSEKGFVKAIFNSTKAEPEDHKKPLKKTIDIVLKQMHPVNTTYPLVETLIFNVLIID
jgi:peptidoglycan-associated lipoprotein